MGKSQKLKKLPLGAEEVWLNVEDRKKKIEKQKYDLRKASLDDFSFGKLLALDPMGNAIIESTHHLEGQFIIKIPVQQDKNETTITTRSTNQLSSISGEEFAQIDAKMPTETIKKKKKSLSSTVKRLAGRKRRITDITASEPEPDLSTTETKTLEEQEIIITYESQNLVRNEHQTLQKLPHHHHIAPILLSFTEKQFHTYLMQHEENIFEKLAEQHEIFSFSFPAEDSDAIALTLFENYNCTLYEYLSFGKRRDEQGEWRATRIAVSIADALISLLDNNLIHLNLTSKSILLDSEGGFYLSDLGYTTNFENNNSPWAKAWVASHPNYFAPEILQYRTNYLEFSKQASYALGLLIYEILFGDFPFPFNCTRDERNVSEYWPKFSKYSTELKQIVTELLAPNPEERISLPEAIKRLNEPHAKAAELIRKVEETGNSEAQYQLGFCYSNGNGVPQSFRKAIELYRLSCSQGNANAQRGLGFLYNNGNGVMKDPQKAMEYYQMAADQGDYKATRNLAIMYRYGEHVDTNMEKALDLYQKAAERGSESAWFNLGTIYYFGTNVPIDIPRAIECYERSAELGYVQAMFELAVRHMKGKDVPKDVPKAIELYTKAAEGGDIFSQYNLARCYSKGNGVEKDVVKAAELLQMAADQGDDDSLLLLGFKYAIGEGVPTDLVKAAKLYQMAADRGSSLACYYVARCHEEGEGVLIDVEKAMEVYLLGSHNGEVNSQYKLGRCYENGINVPRNLKIAMDFYHLAGGNDSERARAKIAQLREIDN